MSRLKNAARLLFMWGYVCSVGFDIVILHFACFYFFPVLQCAIGLQLVFPVPTCRWFKIQACIYMYCSLLSFKQIKGVEADELETILFSRLLIERVMPYGWKLVAIIMSLRARGRQNDSLKRVVTIRNERLVSVLC